MTTEDRVRGLIERLSPEPICDDCIGERLALPAPDSPTRVTNELAGTRGFERRKDACSICGQDKEVIRFRPPR